MKTITILLSAYNGAACLPDQLDSLMAQTHPATRILVRDDGSTDGTRKVLADYARRCGCLTCYSGENLGAARSFFDLLARAAGPGEPPTDYYALCDQDDRWLPDRIEAGISLLGQGEDEPMLACGRPRLVDAAFRPLRETRRFVLPQPSFGNAL
ncbi:MAG TPA: glycosyltransferase, partial [Clostridia bacterium]